eukprot:gene23418-30693_t
MAPPQADSPPSWAAPLSSTKNEPLVTQMSEDPFPVWFDGGVDDLMDDDKLLVPSMDGMCDVAPTYTTVVPTTVSAIASVSAEQAAINRAERLTKCREKKKNRTFEKTIRYATRKAYAEVRPRIKGRFVKKEDLEAYYAMHNADMMMIQDDFAPSPTMAC